MPTVVRYTFTRLAPGNENLAGEEGPERKFSSLAAVRTCGLHWSVNLRSGQRDYHIYIAGRSIRPYRPLAALFGPAVKNSVLCGWCRSTAGCPGWSTAMP